MLLHISPKTQNFIPMLGLTFKTKNRNLWQCTYATSTTAMLSFYMQQNYELNNICWFQRPVTTQYFMTILYIIIKINSSSNSTWPQCLYYLCLEIRIYKCDVHSSHQVTWHTILYVKKKKCNCTVNEQIHTHSTRKNKDYHRYGHNLELYNSKPSVAGCIFCNKLTNNIKQITNNNQFARELKKLLINRCYYSIQEYLNEEFSIMATNTNKSI
jgi:hypothetical protein